MKADYKNWVPSGMIYGLGAVAAGLAGAAFVFPQSMLDMMMPVIGSLFVGIAFRAGRKYPKECKRTRWDIDKKLSDAIRSW